MLSYDVSEELIIKLY